MPMTPMPAWPTISEDPQFFINAALYYNSWRKLGCPPCFAEGMLANAEAESSLNPAAVGDIGLAFNLHQRHNKRVLAIIKGTGIDLKSERDIIKIVEATSWELGTLEHPAFVEISKATTAYDAGIACAQL